MGPRKYINMDKNMPHGDKLCVAEIYRNRSKGSPSEIIHESDLILVSITNSLVADTTLGLLILAINMEEAVPSHIHNGKAKAKMTYKKGTVIKVVSNSRNLVLTPEHLAWKLNIGLVKVNPMLRVTTQCGIDTAVHPIIRRYRTYH